MRIGRILIPELGTSSKTDWISEFGTSLEMGWILILELLMGRVCFSWLWSRGQGVLSLALFTLQWLN